MKCIDRVWCCVVVSGGGMEINGDAGSRSGGGRNGRCKD